MHSLLSLRILQLFCLLFIAVLSIVQVVSANGEIPRVRILDENLEIPSRSESEILASQMLIRQGADGFSHPDQLQQLSAEIQHILQLVRESKPPITDVSVVEAYSPGVVIVMPQPDFLKHVQSIVATGAESIPFLTGNQQFDQFNTKFGLYAVKIYSNLELMLLYYDPAVNPQHVSDLLTFRFNEHVKFAEPEFFLGDRPTIKVSKSGETWYVLVRRAWGDCPSGCIHQEFHFFTIKENHVKSIPFEESQLLDEFVMLMDSLSR